MRDQKVLAASSTTRADNNNAVKHINLGIHKLSHLEWRVDVEEALSYTDKQTQSWRGLRFHSGRFKCISPSHSRACLQYVPFPTPRITGLSYEMKGAPRTCELVLRERRALARFRRNTRGLL